MKKKIWIPIVVIALILILFLPIPSGTGTFTALTYKIVRWFQYDNIGEFHNETKVYFFPDNFKSKDELWERETSNMYCEILNATIVEISGDVVTIDADHYGYERMSFNKKNLLNIDVNVGDKVNIIYNSEIMETYPLQITVKRWIKVNSEYVVLNFAEWTDNKFSDFFGYIKEIGTDYVVISHYNYKDHNDYYIRLNGTVSDLCVGDSVNFTFNNAYIDKANRLIKADLGVIYKMMLPV